MSRRRDCVALICGLTLLVIAAGAFWVSIGGAVSWSLLTNLGPPVLIGIGILGIVASRPRRQR